jgi:hypothetical protein
MEPEDAHPTDDGHQSIRNIETIVVGTDTVVDALDYNAQNQPGLSELAYFHIETPVEGTVEPEIEYFDNDPNHRERTKNIRLRPVRFLDRGTSAVQSYPDRETVREELGSDADEAEIDEEHEQRVATWRSEVRNSLNDHIEVTDGPMFDVIDVEYTQ